MKTKIIPTVNDILKDLDKGTYRVGRHEFLADIFKCGAFAISNKFDIKNAKKREEAYLSIIKKYDTDMQTLISEILSKVSFRHIKFYEIFRSGKYDIY